MIVDDNRIMTIEREIEQIHDWCDDVVKALHNLEHGLSMLNQSTSKLINITKSLKEK